MKKPLLLLISTLCCLASFAQTTRYVKEGGSGNGSSWANASGDLQLMINTSAAGDQIWVAKGTYKSLYMLKPKSKPSIRLSLFFWPWASWF